MLCMERIEDVEHCTLRQLGSYIEDVKGTVHSTKIVELCCARHGKGYVRTGYGALHVTPWVERGKKIALVLRKWQNWVQYSFLQRKEEHTSKM